MLLSFSANTIAPDILEKTLIGRKAVVGELELELTEKLLKKQTHQSLLIATRGSGKTHMTKVLYNRIKANQKLNKLVLVAYMNEDERGIANFADFIRHILQSFIKNKEGNYENIMPAIYEIADLSSSQQEKAFVNYLLEYLGDKNLVVLIENLNIIFDEKKGMGLDGQQKLRSLMHEHNRFSLMATSQNLFHQIKDSKAPFYQFFNIRHLQKLTHEQAFELIKIQAELDEATDLLEALKTSKMKGKVRAIYELTGGNHRLLVIFYHFLKTDLVAELSKIFEKTMNDLKPYYEQFLNALAPQQQKIVKYLSASHTPKMGVDIAHHCFIEPRTLSKQTSELVKKGYLDKHAEGRYTYYELKEPLMRICFEITENLNGVTKLFIDFLSVVYDEEHLGKKYLEFKFLALKDEGKKLFYKNEAKIYGKAIPINLLKKLDSLNIGEGISKHEIENIFKNFGVVKNIKVKIDKEKFISNALDFYNAGKYEESIVFIQKAIVNNPSYSGYKFFLAFAYFSLEKYELVVETIKNIKFNDDIKHYSSLGLLGFSYFSMKEYDKAISNLEKAIELEQPNSKHFYGALGLAYLNLKKFKMAAKYIEKAIELGAEFSVMYLALAESYYELGKFEKVVEVFERATELNPDAEYLYDKLVMSHQILGNQREALKILEKAIKLYPNNSYYLFLSGFSYFKLNENNKAIKLWKKGIRLNPEIAVYHFSLGMSYIYLKKYDLAAKAIEKAIEIDSSGNDYYFRYFLGFTYMNLEMYEESIKVLEKGLKVNSNITFPGYYLLLSSNYMATGNLKKSIDSFIKAIQLNNGDKSIYPNLTEHICIFLIKIEECTLQQLQNLQTSLKEDIGHLEEMAILLLYLDIGIRYLKQNDKRAIYDLSKEERAFFKEKVLDKRVNLNNEKTAQK